MKTNRGKLLLLCCILAFAGLGLAACSSSDDSSEEKTITIGCEATTPGWTETDDEGNVSGYEYDIWQEIGERTGYEIEFSVMDWDAMWSMLDDGRIDTVAEQISYTDERNEKYKLSDPYAYNKYCLLSRSGDSSLQSMDDIKDGMTISCESNTSDEIIVDAVEEEYGVTLEPTYYDGISMTDVVNGRCDLWPRAETSCIRTLEEVDGLQILGETDVYEMNVYPFTDNDRGEELCSMVNETLQEMKDDGTLKELSEKWFDMDITTEPEGFQQLR